MSKRFEILKAVAANPGAPAAEIAETIGGDLQKTTWNVRECVKAGLLSKRLDDITRQPGYTLTAEGKQRLAEAKTTGGDSEGGEADAPAAVKESLAAAPAAIPPPQYDPNEVAFTAGVDTAAASQLKRIRSVLLPHVYVGDPAHAPGALECAQHAAGRLVNAEGMVSLSVDAIARAIETLAPCVPGAINTSDMDLQEIADRVVAGVADLAARLENKDDELLKQAAVIVDLRSQLESLQREAMRGAACLSGQDRYTAAGYLVRTPKRKPRITTTQETAVAAALAAARNGSGRGEVFALVPVGKAVRGAEWRPA